MTVSDLLKRIVLMLVLVFALAALAACDTADDDSAQTNQEEQEAESAAEEADSSIEEAAEDTGEAIEEGAEALGANVDEAAEETGDELDQVAEETGEELDQAGEEAEQELAETGEELDQAAEEAGQELEEAGQAAEENLDETGEELEEAGEEAGQELEEAGQELEDAGEELQTELAEIDMEVDEWAQSTDDELEEAAQSVDEELEEAGESAEEELDEAGEEAGEELEEAGQEAAEEVDEAIDEIAELGEILTVEQPVIVNNRLVIDSAYSEEDGFLVIHNASAEGTAGEVIGWARLDDGVNDDVGVDIDTTRATATLYAMVHDDVDGDGVFNEAVDTPEAVDGEPVSAVMTVSILDADDQFVAQPQITLNSVTVQQPAWVVVYAGDENPNRVLGSTLVQAGNTPNIVVPIDDMANVTPTLWVMLHADTGTAGTFEFGQVEDADLPLPEGDDAVGAKIWTVPHISVHNQVLDEAAPTVTVRSVLSQGPGVVVVHADNDGEPGEVLGFAPVPDGYSENIAIQLTAGDLPENAMVALYTDSGSVGQYEEGIDMPAMVDDQMVMDSFETDEPFENSDD